MILILKDSEDLDKVKAFLEKRHNKNRFDAHKFCGILKVDKDALTIQRQLRKEWN